MPRKKKKKASVVRFSLRGKTTREVTFMKREYIKELLAEDGKTSNIVLKTRTIKKFGSAVDASSMATIRKNMGIKTVKNNGKTNTVVTAEDLAVLQGDTISSSIKKRLDLLVASMRREGIDSIFITSEQNRPAVIRQTKELLVDL